MQCRSNRDALTVGYCTALGTWQFFFCDREKEGKILSLPPYHSLSFSIFKYVGSAREQWVRYSSPKTGRVGDSISIRVEDTESVRSRRGLEVGQALQRQHFAQGIK